MANGQLTKLRARLLIVLAACLWSLSGVFAKTINLHGATMAFYRALFAGLLLVPLLRPARVRFRPAMLGMVCCFVLMNLSFVVALTLTTAANAVLLQYTAPLWMFLASVWLLGEPLETRSLWCVLLGTLGVIVIISGNWQNDLWGVTLALFSGASYGGVAVFLRLLRSEDPLWLTTLNHLSGAICLLPMFLFLPNLLALVPRDRVSPLLEFLGVATGWQAALITLAALALFGFVQMGFPYVLFSRGLQAITPQEAGIIALLEAALNPLLTFLVVREVPAGTTIVGGAVILAAVVLRYR